jgi:hypothetical protein
VALVSCGTLNGGQFIVGGLARKENTRTFHTTNLSEHYTFLLHVNTIIIKLRQTSLSPTDPSSEVSRCNRAQTSLDLKLQCKLYRRLNAAFTMRCLVGIQQFGLDRNIYIDTDNNDPMLFLFSYVLTFLGNSKHCGDETNWDCLTKRVLHGMKERG